MATMHYLFCCIFSVTLCYALAVEHRAIAQQRVSAQKTVPELSHEQQLRNRIVQLAVAELGVSEATGNNDGPQVEAYLSYTGMARGNPWCAAFVCWVYKQAGLQQPRNAWSPALFPRQRRYMGSSEATKQAMPADIFGIYNQRLGRIDHAGLVRSVDKNWILTVEGNVQNQVASRRRPVATIHTFADWLKKVDP